MRKFALSAIVTMTTAIACARPQASPAPAPETNLQQAEQMYVAQSTITVSARQAERCASRTIRELQAVQKKELTSPSLGVAAEPAPSPSEQGEVSNYYGAAVEDVDGKLVLRVYAVSAVVPDPGDGEQKGAAARITPTAEARALADRVVASCARRGSRSA